MHSSISPLPSFLFLSSSPNHGELTTTGVVEGFDASRLLFLASLWLYQGGGIGGGSGVRGSDSGGGGAGSMDLSKVGERILSSVRSARALGLIGTSSAEDRPEVPARAAAAAAVARALASVPPHQRLNLPSSSEELSSIYGIEHHGEVVDELEEEFYEEEFDPVMHVLEQVPSEEDELEYYEKKATLRLAQLDKIAERLSRHVMEHHEEMVRGMHLVSEVERDLKIATIICKNGRRHLTSSMNEVSRDLIVTSNSKKKQVLLDMLPVLTELQHALNLQKALEFHVEEGNYCKAFQVLSEYLQLLDSLSKLSAAQEMSRNVEVWLGKTLQKLDALLLQVCQEFVEEKYITVVDAYALIGDVLGLAEKVQSFFMQEVLVETHSILKALVEEDLNMEAVQNSSRLTYSDLCLRIPESKFRQCLLKTLAALFRLMCSYSAIMSFEPDSKMQDNLNKEDDVSGRSEVHQKSVSESSDYATDIGLHKDSAPILSSADECQSTSSGSLVNNGFHAVYLNRSADVVIDEETSVSGDGSPWYELRKDATGFVSQCLQRGRKSLWQLTTTRVSVLLSSAAFNSTSIHQFIRNYDDLKVFILSGEAFCGAEAVEFRNKLTVACEHYFSSFHRQNIHALKMVLEKETWQKLPAEAVQSIGFSGLVGDGVALITQSDVNSANAHVHQTIKFSVSAETGIKEEGCSYWFSNVNPFITESQASTSFSDGASAFGEPFLNSHDSRRSNNISSRNNTKGESTVSEDENEDLLADFIDEDSQLPSRVSKASHPRKHSSQWKGEEAMPQTGTSLCLLRFIDKYARLMQKLEIINVELFKGAQQMFGVYYHYLFQTFGQNAYPNGKTLADSLNYRLKTALNRVTEDCDQWVKSQLAQSASSSPVSFNEAFKHMDVAPATPPGTTFSHPPNSSFGLKERCTAVDTIIFVARILHRAKPHLRQMMLRSNATIVEDFFDYLVDSVPDLVEHIHRTTARLLLHINGYVDRIANVKWEVKELGMEHNGYVDLLLGEFKHYRTRIVHGDIHKEVQELLLDYGVEIVAETLVEGLSRVKRCTDEGRALMSLDLQVLINGLQHFVSKDPQPKLQIVETFVKAYYLPETEFVHWARAHPEYTKSQIIGLINLVATMKSWKRKTRLEVLEKIE